MCTGRQCRRGSPRSTGLCRPLALVEFFRGVLSWRERRRIRRAGKGFDGSALPGVPDDAVIPVHSQGEWGQIAIFPASRLSLHIYAGEQHDRAADLAPNFVNRNFVYAGNFTYKLAPNVLAAFEASQARTQYLGGVLRLNNHYDLALAYLF